MAKMDVLVTGWHGTKKMKLADALTPQVNRAIPAEQAKALGEANAKAIGCIAATMVEKGIWTLADAMAACGQFGIVQVMPAPTPTPAPPGMPTEFKPKV